MAVRRMNELWKSMALALMFGFLLLHSCRGQDADDSTILSTAASPTAAPLSMTTQSQGTVSNTDQTAATSTAGPKANPGLNVQGTPDSTQPSSDNTDEKDANAANTSLPPSLPESGTLSTVVEIITERTKMEHNEVSNKDSIADLNQEQEMDAASGSSAVFASVLVTGLLLAGIIVGIYYFKCHRRTNGKGMKLAEESYMADEENQGNTLVSVAPLNQPEPQEKPSLNGESQEAVKAQTPPAATNGHSTTKTADTEL
ncbi:hypothetical protein QQF64_021222 [Cirrhinus molitorella]|uniref:Uncharacterized protein n=1 Tax=Cirrhinus molitorella TaxID=172907 RepID=A0ABR3LBF7_9TELE